MNPRQLTDLSASESTRWEQVVKAAQIEAD
jgi:hypothetical protein